MSRLRYSDARRRVNAPVGDARIGFEPDSLVGGEIGAIEFATDPKRDHEFAWAISEIGIAAHSVAASATHGFDSIDRIDRANQYGFAMTFVAGHHIEAPVHSV